MNCVTPFNVLRSLTGISSIVAGGQSMEALTGCGASAHRTACRADHVCKDSDLYPVIRRNITLDARVSTTTLRGRTSSVTCQAARITRRWVRRPGRFHRAD